MRVPQRILIVKLSAIGDVIHALHVLEALKQVYPRARIDWVVEEDAYNILEGHPAIDRIFLSRRKSWLRGVIRNGSRAKIVKEVSDFLKDIRAFEYDLVIDLQGLLKSGILTGLARGRRKIGMSDVCEGAVHFLNEKPVPVNFHSHAIERYLQVPKYLGWPRRNLEGNIPIFERDRVRVHELMQDTYDSHRMLLAINPMAKWITKLWEPERFAFLAERLMEDLGCDVVFTGSPGDRATIDEIVGKMRIKPINLAGMTTLKELAYLYTLCKALITTDTGPMHIAAAVKCPVIALFGPTAPWRTGPYGAGHRVIRSDVKCSPCFKKKCDHLSCMKEIVVEDVFRAVQRMIKPL